MRWLLLILPLLFPIAHCIDCNFACQGVSITSDQAICFQNCEQKYIVMFSIIGVVLLMVLICLYCCCSNRRCIFRSRRMKKLHLQHDLPAATLTKQELIVSKDLFVRAATASLTIPNFYLARPTRNFLKVEKISEEAVGDQLYHLNMSGSDTVGQWSAEGSFMGREDGVYLWFLLEYDSPEAPKQKEVSTSILMEGTVHGQYGFRGQWSSYDEAPQRKGGWMLIARQQDSQGGLVEVATATNLM